MNPAARLRARLTLLTVVAAVFALALAWGTGASPASAHDVLLKTSPADGATVKQLPDKVTLTFDNPALALGTELQVTGPEGQVQQGKPVLVNNTVSQAIRSGSPAGDYTVVWRVTSQDGHPVSGTFSFTATEGNGGAESAPTTGAPTTGASATPAPTSSAVAPSATAPSAAPSSTTASTPVSSGAGDDQQDSAGSSGPWIAGVVALVIVLGGVAVFLASRKKS